MIVADRTRPSEITPIRSSFADRIISFCRGSFGRTVFWLIAFLMAFDVFLIRIRPLAFVQIPGMVLSDQQATGAKYHGFINQLNTPEVLILGSSLILFPAARVDNKLWDLKLKQSDINWYCQSRYFDKVLQERLGRPVHSYNMALAGLVVSESKLLLKNIVESGKAPRVVLLFLAPRDFIDHHSLFGEKSRVYQYFAQCGSLKTLKLTGSLQQDAQLLLSRSWNYFRLRGDYNRVFSAMTCDFLHRAPNFAQAQLSKPYTPMKVQFVSPGADSQLTEGPRSIMAVKKDLEYYEDRYLPIDRGRMNLEFEALINTFELAKANRLKVRVIGMPLTSANLKLLPADFLKEYNDRLTHACRSNAVPFINFQNDSRFTDGDFVDSVHLNAQGGIKFFNLLADALTNTRENRADLIHAIQCR